MKDLENVEVSYANGDHHSNKIQLTEDIGMMMKYPNFEIMNQMGQSESFEDIVGVVSSCIEIIYQGDEVFNTSDHPISEVMDFVESLTQDQFEKINTNGSIINLIHSNKEIIDKLPSKERTNKRKELYKINARRKKENCRRFFRSVNE